MLKAELLDREIGGFDLALECLCRFTNHKIIYNVV